MTMFSLHSCTVLFPLWHLKVFECFCRKLEIKSFLLSFSALSIGNFLLKRNSTVFCRFCISFYRFISLSSSISALSCRKITVHLLSTGKFLLDVSLSGIYSQFFSFSSLNCLFRAQWVCKVRCLKLMIWTNIQLQVVKMLWIMGQCKMNIDVT